MKFKVLLLIALFCFMASGSASAQEPMGALVVVADDANITENDQAVMDRLESVHGLVIDYVSATTVDESWADGMALIYASSTVNSGDLDNKLKDVEVPFWLVESYGLDNNGMSYDNDSTRYSSTFQRDIEILAPDHYLAAGLSGEVAVFDSYDDLPGMQGLPSENGTVIGQYLEWDEGELPCLGAIFAYEKGAVMADTTEAAERRYFFGVHDTGFLFLTEDGMKLWDAGIDWLLYKDQDDAVADKVEQPTEFKLAQNYPNPFNPTTTISFELAGNSTVQLFVCDVQGRLVAELENAQLNAGVHHYAFNAEHLPSGIYMYTLQTGEASFTEKMTLLR